MDPVYGILAIEPLFGRRFYGTRDPAQKQRHPQASQLSGNRGQAFVLKEGF